MEVKLKEKEVLIEKLKERQVFVIDDIKGDQSE